MTDEPDFIIQAEPSLRLVTPGAEVTYFLRPTKNTSPDFSLLGFQWFALNDPETVSLLRPERFNGPLGRPRWEKAKWSRVGVHHIVCRVNDRGTVKDYVYEQRVATLPEALKQGPAMPVSKRDPVAILDGTNRRIDAVIALAEQQKPKGELGKKHEQELQSQYRYRDALAHRLRSTNGRLRIPVKAKLLIAQTQSEVELQVFLTELQEVAPGKPAKWLLVDWTNPADERMAGEYSGEGATTREAILDAISTWQTDNRYPEGGIRIQVDTIPGIERIDQTLVASGGNRWDKLAEFFQMVTYAGMCISAAVTALVPTPPTWLASATLWTGVFSSTAAAAVNIAQRSDMGVSNFRANAMDMLSIASNVIGISGSVWVRGAMAKGLVGGAAAATKLVFIGQATTDGVQGILVAADTADEIEQVKASPQLTPTQKIDQITILLANLASTTLFYAANVKATARDAAHLNQAAKHFTELSPAQKIELLKDPKAEIDLSQPPQAEGHGGDSRHTTTVHIDMEEQVPHITGPVPKPRQFPSALAAEKRGIRGDDDRIFARYAVKFKRYLFLRNSKSAALKFLGKPGYAPKPEPVKAKTLGEGSRCKPENIGLAAANPSDPEFQDLLKSAGLSYPEYKEMMLKKGYRIDEANDFLVIDIMNGNKFYSDADLHGMYSENGLQIEVNRPIRDELNDSLGIKLIQHGSHDEWPDRLKPESGRNRGPQGKTTVYLPDGSKQHLETWQDMRQFYREHGLPWDTVWNNSEFL